MRHSAYADMCAHARISMLNDLGMTPEWFKEQGIGPLLFKEQTEYFKEVFINERLNITVEAGQDTGSDKSIQVINRVLTENGELAAVHTVIVGWLDMKVRKVVRLPELIRNSYLTPTEKVESPQTA